MRVRLSVGADSAFPDLRLLPATAALRPVAIEGILR